MKEYKKMKVFEPTLSASKIAYQIEAMKILNSNKKVILKYVNTLKKMNSFPKELDYITSFYDKKTGSSGCFFENKKNNQYILAYSGTNPYADLLKDMETNIYDIALGQGAHYNVCFKFYSRLRKKYGENIVLTGHSLGGNIVQRVAIEYNVKKSVIYNSAPLYIENGVEIFMKKNEENFPLYKKRIKRYKKNKQNIENKISSFTGVIIHISSEEDILNKMLSKLNTNAVFCHKRYIIKNAGKHTIKALSKNNSDIIKKIVDGTLENDKRLEKNYKCNAEHIDRKKEELKKGSINEKASLEYFTSLFLEKPAVLGFMDGIFSDIEISQFIKNMLK